MRVCVVGAGFSGAVIARELADAGMRPTVIEEKPHVGGHCHTERDASTGVMVHVYGPHIFHTDNEDVWNYVCRFADMAPYINRVKAQVKGQIYSLPINLHTINQFFQKSLSPNEARDFIANAGCAGPGEPVTFEDQALRFVGEDLYKAFFYGYTKKQWGVEPAELPASILKRLPLRFNYNDNYFSHRYQGIPRDGYTELIAGMLEHEGVDLRTDCAFEDLEDDFDHIVYTGPIDRYYRYAEGRLGYRTLDFERIDAKGDYQGTAVINYCDLEVPYTRIAEHKHFAPWEAGELEDTVCFREYSRACTPADTPFYPIRLVNEKKMIAAYAERARADENITFAGRLATYSYIDMDVSVARALETAQALITAHRQGQQLPVFVHAPD